jgi:hypothetical protein
MVVNIEMETQAKLQTNWPRNITYTTNIIQKVTSVEEIQSLLRSQVKVKVTGTAHTFNAITDTPETRLSLNLMPETVLLDAAACKVIVNTGIMYDELCPVLPLVALKAHFDAIMSAAYVLRQPLHGLARGPNLPGVAQAPRRRCHRA